MYSASFLLLVPHPLSVSIFSLTRMQPLPCRLVVIVTEARVILWDLTAKSCRELPKAAFDGKSPTCCAFLFLSGQVVPPGVPPQVMASPVLAVGASDGVVRLFQLSTLHPVAVMGSPHKSGVTQLTVTHAARRPYEVLAAGFVGGGVTTWEPFAKPLGVGRGNLVVPHVGDLKLHDKPVIGLAVGMVHEAPDAPLTLLMSAGEPLCGVWG
jgi:hypothetical protein